MNTECADSDGTWAGKQIAILWCMRDTLADKMRYAWVCLFSIEMRKNWIIFPLKRLYLFFTLIFTKK